MSNSLRRRRRWAVPLVAALAAMGFAAAPNLMPAGAAQPDLPPLTPAELLTKAQTAQVTSLSGTIAMTANLGLPALPGSLTGGGSTGLLTSLLSGTHTAQIWLDGPDHQRLALNAPMAETDWIHNGHDAWSWDSTTQRVVHVTMPAPTASQSPRTPDKADAAEPSKPAEQTPEALANELLAQVDPTTKVTVQSPRYVADRPVYQLVIAPRSTASTIGQISISVDAATGLPIDVAITPAGATSPAFELGFTQLSFDKPSASEFAFKPPTGASVTESADPAALLAPGGARRHERGARSAPALAAPASTTAASDVLTSGTGWDTVAILPAGSATQASGLTTLINSAPPVQMPGGTAHLLTTKLVNALFLPDGKIAVGAVTPDALQAAAVGH